jgi:hypothetical protein
MTNELIIVKLKDDDDDDALADLLTVGVYRK